MKLRLIAVALSLAALVGFVPLAVAHEDLPSEVEQLLGDAHADDPAPGDPMYTADDTHSPNMSLVGNLPYAEGSDLAFQGTTVVAGNYGSPGGFRLIDVSDPTAPRQLGQLDCPGPQNDVSVWGDIVVLSVDSPRSSPECGAGAASTADVLAGDTGKAWEGIRIVDVSDPAKPRQLKAVYTDCGSHTHTLVPDRANDRLLVYVQSYPLGGQGARCNLATHRKISVVEIPLDDPGAARVVSTPSVAPAIGCHDTTVLTPRKLAASACIDQTQLWDISDLENPRTIATIRNPAIGIHHSTAFSWDAGTLVIGDEFAGAAESSPCTGAGADHVPLGALWFYDVRDPRAPAPISYYRIPEVPTPRCGAHNFNPIPLRSGRDVLSAAWYEGGTGVIDFTDPRQPRRLGFYIPRDPQAESWSSYWYNGRIYANNFGHGRGLDVLRIKDPALRGARRLDRLNPQTQEFLIGAGQQGGERFGGHERASLLRRLP